MRRNFTAGFETMQIQEHLEKVAELRQRNP